MNLSLNLISIFFQTKREDGQEEKSRSLINATLVLRLLYDLAVDSYDRAQTLPAICCTKSLQPGRTSGDGTIRRPLNLVNQQQPEPILVHPGVVLAMFQLIPAVWTDRDVQGSIALQLLLADVIQSLTRSERNVQILCDVGFPAEILKRAGPAVLDDESHYLHGPLLTVLEQLVRQALEPKDLRQFLRMGNPLNCLLPECGSGGERAGLPLFRLKSLVSMSTPKDVGRSGSALPPFVEFDMQPEGFGCLFLPSVAPQCSLLQQGSIGGDGQPGNGGQVTMGGVGSGGDRVFPAPTGMSYSTWICVDKFSDPRLDPHEIRLLTLVRNVTTDRPADGGQDLACLSVVLSPRDKALLVSTQETPLPKGN